MFSIHVLQDAVSRDNVAATHSSVTPINMYFDIATQYSLWIIRFHW